MPKKQHDEESLSSFSFHVQQPGAGINGFLESAVTVSGLQQGLLVGSDIIGYSAASAFGYGSSFEGYSDLFQDVVADPTSFDPDDLRANIAFGALKSEGAILM